MVPFSIPKAAVIWREFIRQDDLAILIKTKFQFEVNQAKTNLCKPILQQFIDTTRFFLNISNLFIIGNIQKLHMLIIDEWVIQLIVFIVKFNDWSFQVQTFFNAKTFRERTRSHITKNHLQRNNFYFLVELFCVRNTFYKVSSYTRSIQFFKNKRRNLII